MLTIFAYILAVSSSCIKIECQDTFDPYSRCIEVTETIKVSSCPLGSYCPSYSPISSYNQSLFFEDIYCESLPFSPAIDLCTDPSFISTQNVGDQCCKNENCLSNLCQNLICMGITPGKSCNQTSACVPGYYCSSNFTCVPALTAGSKCQSDLDCVVGHGCNLNYCTKLWSVGFSDRASDAKFCVSNYLFGGYCDMIVIQINATAVNSPFQCRLQDTCNYYSAAFRLIVDSDSCVCSGNVNTSVGYCGKYINQAQGMFEDLIRSIAYQTSNCNGPKAHSADPFDLWQCGSISTSTYQNYLLQTQRNNFWNVFQSGVLKNCASSLNLFQVSADIWLFVSSLLILWGNF